MRNCLTLGTALLSLLVASAAQAATYDEGTVIIPMDTTYQNSGMLKAYGLVYELLRNGIPVDWAIRKGKDYGAVDFTASAMAYPSGAAVVDHGYRGGPWLVDQADAAAAMPIIASWQGEHTTTVHVATTSFDTDVAHHLVTAPTIAMFADGNQKIARKYMQAAAIPDSTLDYAWPDSSPDMMDPNEVAGPTTADHADGKLFDSDGDPVYCQFMSMHWGVSEARAKPEVVAEVRSFLRHPTHFFAECQAVNAYENDLVNGLFLTESGFEIASKPSAVDFYNADYPFAQLDGSFKTTGGSEPAYSLPVGDAYKDTDIVMLTTQGTPVGVGDVWMTGYLDGTCSISDDIEGQDAECLRIGKVSYLGGHEYGTDVPISTHPETQGTRLFLNSLFEAPCATRLGRPTIELEKEAPATTASPLVTFTLSYLNEGPTTVLNAVLRDAVPSGATFVSATDGGAVSDGVVSWDLQNLGDQEAGSVSFTVSLGSHGTYQNQAHLDYQLGLNAFSVASNTTETVFDTDGDGIPSDDDICPDDYNPGQDLSSDASSCGACGTVCSVDNGVSDCSAGTCEITFCEGGYRDCDGAYDTGCEYASSGFADDESNCGDCGDVCAPRHASGLCVSGACTIDGCDSGFVDCNGIAEDGCEYDETDFASDHNHCGDCGTRCATDELCSNGNCEPFSCPPAGAEGPGAPECGDGADNDCDGMVDGDDDDCGPDEPGAGGSGGSSAEEGGTDVGAGGGPVSGGSSGTTGATGSTAGPSGGSTGASSGTTSGVSGEGTGANGTGAAENGGETSTGADSGDEPGCGCRLAPGSTALPGAGGIGLLVALASFRRRRRVARPARS